MTIMRNKAKVAEEVASPAETEDESASGSKPPSRVLFRSGTVQTVLICFALFAVAMSLNLYRLDAPSLWFDEVLSVTRARQPLPVLLHIISATQPNMALYYVVLHFWLRLIDFFGIHATEAIVRFPSALSAASGSLLLYLLARRLFPQFIALSTMLLYVLNPLQLTYAQETRSYSLQLLFVILSWYALCVLFSEDLPLRRTCAWWICFVLSAVLAIYSQLFSELILAAQVVTFVLLCIVHTNWREHARQQFRPFVVSCVWIGILIAPLLYASRVGSKTGWLPIPRPNDICHLFLTLTAQNRLLLALFALTILAGLCVILLSTLPQGQNILRRLALFSRAEFDEKQWQQHYACWLPLAILLLCWLLFPIASSYLVSQRAIHLFSPRYLVVVVPAFVLLIALGLAVLRWKSARTVAGLCLVLLCLSCVPGYYASAQVEDWRTGTQWLQRHYQPGDGLICFDNAQGCAVDIEYYLQAYPRGPARFDADSPGYFPWIDYDLTNRLGDSAQALNIVAIQTYAAEHLRLFFGIGRASLDDPRVYSTLRWLDAHYRLLAQESTGTLTIYLYATEITTPPDLA